MQGLLVKHKMSSHERIYEAIQREVISRTYQTFVSEANRWVWMKSLIMHIHHLDILLKEHLEFEKIGGRY
jgi:hypothetical protein